MRLNNKEKAVIIEAAQHRIKHYVRKSEQGELDKDMIECISKVTVKIAYGDLKLSLNTWRVIHTWIARIIVDDETHDITTARLVRDKIFEKEIKPYKN